MCKNKKFTYSWGNNLFVSVSISLCLSISLSVCLSCLSLLPKYSGFTHVQGKWHGLPCTAITPPLGLMLPLCRENILPGYSGLPLCYFILACFSSRAILVTDWGQASGCVLVKCMAICCSSVPRKGASCRFRSWHPGTMWWPQEGHLVRTGEVLVLQEQISHLLCGLPSDGGHTKHISTQCSEMQRGGKGWQKPYSWLPLATTACDREMRGHYNWFIILTAALAGGEAMALQSNLPSCSSRPELPTSCLLLSYSSKRSSFPMLSYACSYTPTTWQF